MTLYRITQTTYKLTPPTCVYPYRDYHQILIVAVAGREAKENKSLFIFFVDKSPNSVALLSGRRLHRSLRRLAAPPIGLMLLIFYLAHTKVGLARLLSALEVDNEMPQ